ATERASVPWSARRTAQRQTAGPARPARRQSASASTRLLQQTIRRSHARQFTKTCQRRRSQSVLNIRISVIRICLVLVEKRAGHHSAVPARKESQAGLRN